MPEAVALHASTTQFLAAWGLARSQLATVALSGTTNGYDRSPYQNVTGDQYGFPASDTLAADHILALKRAKTDRLSWSKEHAISSGIQLALLEGFKRDLQDRRLRKGQRLARWQTDMGLDQSRRAILVSNIAGKLPRRNRD